jgi:hypothetical protein
MCFYGFLLVRIWLDFLYVIGGRGENFGTITILEDWHHILEFLLPLHDVQINIPMVKLQSTLTSRILFYLLIQVNK